MRPNLRRNFSNASLESLIHHQIAFVSMDMGKTPHDYAGRSMLHAHRGIAITKASFDCTVELLSNALTAGEIEPSDVQVIVATVNTLRSDIVERWSRHRTIVAEVRQIRGSTCTEIRYRHPPDRSRPAFSIFRSMNLSKPARRQSPLQGAHFQFLECVRCCVCLVIVEAKTHHAARSVQPYIDTCLSDISRHKFQCT